MRRRGFLGALLALPLVRFSKPKIVIYDSVTTHVNRYSMTTYSMRIAISPEAMSLHR